MATKSLGTTFTFTPAGGSAAVVGKLSSIGEITCDSALIDVTTLDSPGGCRAFLQGARDAGEIRLTGYHLKTDVGQAALRAAYLTGNAGTALITFPDGATVSFPALVKSCVLGAASVDGAVGFGCILRACGQVTVTMA